MSEEYCSASIILFGQAYEVRRLMANMTELAMQNAAIELIKVDLKVHAEDPNKSTPEGE